MDPSEIHAVKVEETQRLCQSLHEAVAAICAMRDHAAEIYRVECGQPWSATTGSRTGRTLTASQIDARDFLATRTVAKRDAHAPTDRKEDVVGQRRAISDIPGGRRTLKK